MNTLSRTLGNYALSPGLSYGWAERGYELYNWANRSLYGCVCDSGYLGPDCSTVACPRNDDPVTVGQAARSVTLSVSNPLRALAGSEKLGFSFGGEVATFQVGDSAATIRAAIESMKAVQTAAVAVSGSATAAQVGTRGGG